jgi:alpha-aminoadipate/glutamate carrier protein LysW
MGSCVWNETGKIPLEAPHHTVTDCPPSTRRAVLFQYYLEVYKELTMFTTLCPECDAEITLETGTENNEIIVCPDCGVDLEVLSVNPAKLELALMEQEDWGE